MRVLREEKFDYEISFIDITKTVMSKSELNRAIKKYETATVNEVIDDALIEDPIKSKDAKNYILFRFWPVIEKSYRSIYAKTRKDATIKNEAAKAEWVTLAWMTLTDGTQFGTWSGLEDLPAANVGFLGRLSGKSVAEATSLERILKRKEKTDKDSTKKWSMLATQFEGLLKNAAIRSNYFDISGGIGGVDGQRTMSTKQFAVNSETGAGEEYTLKSKHRMPDEDYSVNNYIEDEWKNEIQDMIDSKISVKRKNGLERLKLTDLAWSILLNYEKEWTQRDYANELGISIGSAHSLFQTFKDFVDLKSFAAGLKRNKKEMISALKKVAGPPTSNIA